MDKINSVRILFDLIVLLLLLVVLLCLKYAIDPAQRGFDCNDYSVNYLYKSSTVSSKWLFVITVVVPAVFMLLTELSRTLYRRFKSTRSNALNEYIIRFCGSRTLVLGEQTGNLLINFIYFMFGNAVNSIITNIGKITVGRLRPNFLDVCQPDRNPYTTYCSSQLNGYNGKTYLYPGVDFKCMQSDPKQVNDSRKSFPSGHSSSTFYAMIFLIFYIHRVWNKRSLGLLPQFFQVCFFGFAVFVAISRVLDNKHHPTDVLAGSLLGILVAVFTSYYLNLFFKKYNYRAKYDLIDKSQTNAVDSETEKDKYATNVRARPANETSLAYPNNLDL